MFKEVQTMRGSMFYAACPRRNLPASDALFACQIAFSSLISALSTLPRRTPSRVNLRKGSIWLRHLEEMGGISAAHPLRRKGMRSFKCKRVDDSDT